MIVDLIGLFRGLVRLETQLWNRVDAKVQGAHGVPLAWLEVMQIVDTTEGCRVRDIAHALSITVGGASKVVDRVEGAGFCRREPNVSDARSNLIRLTEPGVSLLSAANGTIEAALASLIGSAAGAAELVQLAVTVSRLRQQLRAADSEQMVAQR
jgi:DNA-binding MarR family transcriptional regulator